MFPAFGDVEPTAVIGEHVSDPDERSVEVRSKHWRPLIASGFAAQNVVANRRLMALLLGQVNALRKEPTMPRVACSICGAEAVVRPALVGEKRHCDECGADVPFFEVESLEVISGRDSKPVEPREFNGAAAVMSTIVPGLGQIYRGHIWFGLALLSCFATAWLLGVLLAFAPLWIFGIFHAGKSR